MFAAFRQRVDNPQNVVNAFGKRAALFNPGLVAGVPHVAFAWVSTKRAVERGECIARSYFIEFLVRLSGRGQIEKALAIGLQKGTYIGVAADSDVIAVMEEQFKERDDSLFALTKEKEESIREFFEVSGSGKVLQKNIFEKIALLSVY
jgi:tRNA threonylcarbamoyladenosine modification (KEOPS) complex Cgi121 subunit